ncbi:MAG: sigma-54 interaction domain-containing protein [Candidatus Binatia bacterium]
MSNRTTFHPPPDQQLLPEDGERHVVALPILDSAVVIHSTLMCEVLDLVARIAPSDASILLTGESGVGKEVVARAIHQLSPRNGHEFVAINCATLSDDTLANELFGHEKGAFTSADERKSGVVEIAHGGTLFLDEVNEMGLACQAKVLRALERREFRRLGGTRKIKVDVRLVAAANVDLEAAVRAHQFREDLFYRLNVVRVHIPPLRERREAIAPMARQFLREFCEKYGKRSRIFTDDALARLTHYAWPGNVRELRNVVESLVLMTKGERISGRDLPANIRTTPTQAEIRLPIGITLQEAEKEILRCCLEVFPTKKEVARVLGIGLRTLHAKIRAYDLPARRQRASVSHSATIAV